jgi:hypothetical protein
LPVSITDTTAVTKNITLGAVLVIFSWGSSLKMMWYRYTHNIMKNIARLINIPVILTSVRLILTYEECISKHILN